jgi:hypothetical protein
MREINKIALHALGKMLLIFFPLVVFIFYGCYVIDKLIISYGMRQFTFVPATISAVLSYYIAGRLIGKDMVRMAELRREEKINKRDKRQRR